MEITPQHPSLPSTDYDLDDLRQRLAAEEETDEEGEDGNGENGGNLPWIYDRSQRNLASLARKGLLEARRIRSFDTMFDNDHYDDEISGGILDGDDLFLPLGYYQGDEYRPQGKRHIASVARMGMIPYAKRHIGSAARLGYLDRFKTLYPNAFKRHIASLAKSGGIYQNRYSGKRNIGAIARQGGLPHHRPKRSFEDDSDITNDKDEDSEILEAIKALEMMSMYEGNNDNYEEADEEDQDVSKRHIGSLARLGWLPPRMPQRRHSSSPDGDTPHHIEGSPGFKRGMQPLARASPWRSSLRQAGEDRRRGVRGLQAHYGLASSPRYGHHPSWYARKRPRGVRSLSQSQDLGSGGTTTVRYRQKAGSAYLPPSLLHNGKIWKRSATDEDEEEEENDDEEHD